MEENVTKSTIVFTDSPTGTQTLEPDYEREKWYIYGFWGYVTSYLLISSISVMANGFLLFVTYGERNSGVLRYLCNAIKSLAIADMLFGLIGAPIWVFNDYRGYSKLFYSIRKKNLYKIYR